MPYAPVAHTDVEVRSWIENQLLPAGNVTVAEVDSEVVGFVATSNDGNCMWVDHMYVLPASTGHGFGAALFRHALGGVTQPVRLYTFQNNSGARRFYERFGFSPIEFTDGSTNEEKCPDVLYERSAK